MKMSETLEEALKAIMTHVREISNLEQEIDEKWGVTIRLSDVYPPGYSCTGRVIVRRGIEAVENALGAEAKTSGFYHDMRELRHYGIEFTQYADEKTKTFVKAFKQPPKVMIVEDEDNA